MFSTHYPPVFHAFSTIDARDPSMGQQRARGWRLIDRGVWKVWQVLAGMRYCFHAGAGTRPAPRTRNQDRRQSFD
jgi:hypothetical protein